MKNSLLRGILEEAVKVHFLVHSPLSTIYQMEAMTETKISVTLDEELAKEIDGYLRDLVKEAADSAERIPKQSNVYEEIVRKGWEVVKKERKK